MIDLQLHDTQLNDTYVFLFHAPLNHCLAKLNDDIIYIHMIMK